VVAAVIGLPPASVAAAAVKHLRDSTPNSVRDSQGLLHAVGGRCGHARDGSTRRSQKLPGFGAASAVSCEQTFCRDRAINATHKETFDRIREVRAEAIKHTMLARQFSAERRDLMQGLMKDGVSQADIARELGVTRQAVQKMLAC